eukprot:maker-scaffold10_size831480-snap-gene-0.16 protein:Tk01803 transcript:maker-scaffold10_size831480-snap-gene-0.16-mRNA-1 annotation:"PREDICTED: uncharacterized protein LOC100872180"
MEGSVNRYLDKQNAKWNPSLNKNHLRNLLRKHIQESNYLDSGVDRIVDQVVNPKILAVIEPQVEGVVCNVLGVEKPEEKAESVVNGNVSDMEMSSPHPGTVDAEKLSNISSEDIEMRSAAEDETNGRPNVDPTLRPSSGAHSEGLRAAMSPLSNAGGQTPQIQGGDISPLTPPQPPSPGSPHTPPLPPPPAPPEVVMTEEVIEEEVVTHDDQTSPVSDTDFDNISPPKDSPETPSACSLPSPPGDDCDSLPPLPPSLPPPPPPMLSGRPRPPPPPADIPPIRPPSPLTSPIGSSSDDMEMASPARTDSRASRRSRKAGTVSGPSDISDTDLPASNSDETDGEKDVSEADLNALEKARAELQAKLAAASIDDDTEQSEGEIRSDEDSEGQKSYVEKFNDIMSSDRSLVSTPNLKPADQVSPISDSMSPLAMSKTPSSNPEDPKSSSESDEDKNQDKAGNSKGGEGHNSDDDQAGGSGSLGQEPHARSEGEDKEGKSPNEEKNGADDKQETREDLEDKLHKQNRHDKSHKQDRHHHKGSHKHHEKSSREDKKRRKDDGKHRRSSTDDKMKESEREKKKLDKDRIAKEKIRLQEIEKKIKEKDKFSDFDMFAPKPPKPKPVLTRPPSSASSRGSLSPGPLGSKSPLAFGAKSPLAFGSKTPPTFGSKPPPSFGSKTPPAFGRAEVKTSIDPEKLKMIKDKARQEHVEAAQKVAAVERRVFPEFPLSKSEGDKLKQHEVDILEAKKRLEEARQRRLVEKKKLELEKKRKRKMSDTHTPAKATPKVEKKKDKPAVTVIKEKKKLTLDDLSDEDEVSDWSDVEAPTSVKKAILRKRKTGLRSSSDEDKSHARDKRQTRTLALKAKADSILNSDPETKRFEGFGQMEQALSAVLKDYLDDEDNVSVASVDLNSLDDDLDPKELITLEELDDPEATCGILKTFGESHSHPVSLKASEDDADFHGFDPATLDGNDSTTSQRLFAKLDLDENGNTFGMRAEDFVCTPDIEEDGDEVHTSLSGHLKVNMETALLQKLEFLANSSDSAILIGLSSNVQTDPPHGHNEADEAGGSSPLSSGSSKENQEDPGLRRKSKRVSKTAFEPGPTLSKRPRRSGKAGVLQM